MIIIKTSAFGDQQPLFPEDPSNPAPMPQKPPRKKPQLSGNFLDDLDYLHQLRRSVPQLAKEYNIPLKQFAKGYYAANVNNKLFVIEDDGSHKDAHEWLYSLHSHELQRFVQIPDHSEEFWENPPHELYHGTDPEFVPNIMKEGLKASCETRGFGNRNVGCAVFTSSTPEGTDSYGNRKGQSATIAINVMQMKQDGYMPRTEQEEGYDEKKALETLAWKIGIEDFYFEINDSSLAEDTVVFFDNIPPKYLKIYEPHRRM